MNCCCDVGEEVVLHQRLLPWNMIYKNESGRQMTDNGQDILDRETKMGLDYVRKLIPEALHEYIRADKDYFPYSEIDTSNSDDWQVAIKLYLKVI